LDAARNVRAIVELIEELKDAMTQHIPVLLREILELAPNLRKGKLLDVTAGGGGHFFSILSEHPEWVGECWDRDPLAQERIEKRASDLGVSKKTRFLRRTFGEAPHDGETYDLILADIGVSSFQLDDLSRGMSLHSDSPPDFRMDPEHGIPFVEWLARCSESDLVMILEDYGEEPRAKKLAQALKRWGPETFASAKVLAAAIERELSYKTPSRVHPATRAFQALRIAINDELGELRRLLAWAPRHLNPGGRLLVISFHSLEDRIVKNEFRDLAKREGFVILTKKPLMAAEEETRANPRSRSAKLRALERAT
jgi:16S rRNA (cytosine1402-N4)-methyltransferase